MRKAGADVRGYGNPLEAPLKINNRWHEKHVIADGAASIEGGMNIADEYALGGTDKPVNTNTGRAWRDVDARVRGPAAADSETAFIKNWNEVRPEGTPIEGPRSVTRNPPAIPACASSGINRSKTRTSRL